MTCVYGINNYKTLGSNKMILVHKIGVRVYQKISRTLQTKTRRFYIE